MSDGIFPVTMPKWGMEMTEGKIVSWLVDEGDEVSKGDEIVEIETDKIVNICEATYSGTLRRRLVDEEETRPVGDLIAVIGGADTAESDIDSFIASYKPAGTAAGGTPNEEAKPESAPAPAAKAAGSATVSPVARRYAEQHGIDLSAIQGTGRGGRISLDDVKAAEGQAPAAPGHQEQSAAPGAAYRAEVLSPMRKAIARRLSEAKSTIPHFYLSVEIKMGNLLEARTRYNDTADQKASINDFLIRAMALALQEVPEANVQFADDELRYYEQADVAVAVAIDGGLVTPVVRDAAARSVAEIAAVMRDLSARANEKKLKAEDLEGGSISLSNLGMYGIRNFDAVINPPQAAIVAVGAVEERPAKIDGELALHPMMSATMSCDHRAIDGALGARYLATFKALLEDPSKLLG